MQSVYSYFRFYLPAIQHFILILEKSYEGIYDSPWHVSVTIGNILIAIMRFAHYDLLLGFNSTFMADFKYWDTIQIWQNLTEYHYYSTSTKAVISQIDVHCSQFQSLNMLPFHIRHKRLKLIIRVETCKISK